jgi:putative iron-only hydrogenase system regulator
MESRIAIIGIMVEDFEATEKINIILHEHGKYIVGRMGIPYKDRSIHVISVIIDAPNDIISSISGKLGMINGVTAKSMYSKLPIEKG